MKKELKEFIATIRNLTSKGGVEDVTLARLRENPVFEAQISLHNIVSDEHLVELILENERHMFEVIFNDFNFDGNEDAIDILFTVSKEMSTKFLNLSPSFSHKFSVRFPEVYQQHLDKRVNFINKKIQINLNKGITQGMYRNDLSVELVARRYISRLLDIHDVESFPPEQFSFNTLFYQMFENFVMSIATQKGIDYYNEKKSNAKF